MNSDQITEETSVELAETLRSLDVTMRQHMAALRKSKETLAVTGAMVRQASMSPLPAATTGASTTTTTAATTAVEASAPALAPAAPALLGAVTARAIELRSKGDEVVEVTRNKKTTIQVRIVFMKLGEIDTLRDRFTADVFVQAKWREPAMDGLLPAQTTDIDWSAFWKPKLFIENTVGEPKETIEHTVAFDTFGRATICQKRRINGSFQEFMELNQFPFDTQDLTVTLTSERPDKELELVEDANERCALNAQSFVDEQEWRLHKYIHSWKRTRTDDNKHPKTMHSAFSAACKASRRPEFFIWNIFVVMFLICSLSFATFSVELDLPQNRLQLSFILLLTTVSFKFVVNQSLPMIAYLTYLDKYILGSMAILCCICVWHAVVPLLNTADKCCSSNSEYADNVALIVLAAIYIGFHLIFVFVIAFVARERRRSLYQTNVITPELQSLQDNGKEIEDNSIPFVESQTTEGHTDSFSISGSSNKTNGARKENGNNLK